MSASHLPYRQCRPLVRKLVANLPCSRKKTRCPAERPKCSFCQRLNQTCTYLPRHASSGGSRRRRTVKLYDPLVPICVPESDPFGLPESRMMREFTTWRTKSARDQTFRDKCNGSRLQTDIPMNSHHNLQIQETATLRPGWFRGSVPTYWP